MAEKRTGNFPDSSSKWRPGRLIFGVAGALLSLTVLSGLFLPVAEGYPPSGRPLHLLGDLNQTRVGDVRISGREETQNLPGTETHISGADGGIRRPPSTEVLASATGTPFPRVAAPRRRQVPHRSAVRPRTAPHPRPGGRNVSGRASWYCFRGISACVHNHPGGLYAAAGPKLRVAMGGVASATGPQPWRGRSVTVCITGTSRCVRVRLIDWCQCSWKKPGEKIIDLYGDAMRVLAPNFMSRGVLRVTVYTK